MIRKVVRDQIEGLRDADGVGPHCGADPVCGGDFGRPLRQPIRRARQLEEKAFSEQIRFELLNDVDGRCLSSARIDDRMRFDSKKCFEKFLAVVREPGRLGNRFPVFRLRNWDTTHERRKPDRMYDRLEVGIGKRLLCSTPLCGPSLRPATLALVVDHRVEKCFLRGCFGEPFGDVRCACESHRQELEIQHPTVCSEPGDVIPPRGF